MIPQPYILWAAMGASHFVLLAIGGFLGPSGDDATVAWALVGVAAGTATASLALSAAPLAPQTRSIVRMALAESAAVIGLLTSFVGPSPWPQVVAALLGGFAWLAAFPFDGGRPTDVRR